MNSLESRLIMISRLAAKGHELFAAWPHVPLVIERDAARKVPLAVSLADVPPQNRVDLFGRRSVVVANGSSLVSSHHATAREALWLFPVS